MCSKIGHHLVSKQAGINNSFKHTIVVGPEKCCCCCCVLYSSRLKKSLSTKTLQSFLPLICTLPWIYTVRFFFFLYSATLFQRAKQLSWACDWTIGTYFFLRLLNIFVWEEVQFMIIYLTPWSFSSSVYVICNCCSNFISFVPELQL